MDKFINIQLLKHPYNYLVVGLMILIPMIAVALLFPQFNQNSPDPQAG